MSKYTSRFFGEIVPGLTLVIGNNNSGKSSVLMNDAKNARETVPVTFINLEMCPRIVYNFFNTDRVTYGCNVYHGDEVKQMFSGKNDLISVLNLISSTTSEIIYIDFLELLFDSSSGSSYGDLYILTGNMINSVARMYNKSVIATTNSMKHTIGTQLGTGEIITDICSKIFTITKEHNIITLDGKSFELSSDRNLKEIVKKEQTLLEAIDIINEEINSIAIFPEDHSYRLVYTHPYIHPWNYGTVTFLGQTIFRGDLDERIYDEDTDEYESYESFLRRVVGEISKDVYSIFCKLNP